MRCAVFLEKLIRRGDVVPQAFGVRRVCSYPAYGVEPTELYCRSTYADQCFLRAGTYTVDMTVEEGAGKNVRVYTYVDGAAAGQFPAANEDPVEMPFTFTIDSARSVIFTFGVGDWTEDFEWSDFRVHEVGGSAVDVYETRAVLPDEIVSGSISEALCTKRAVTVGISPLSEAFGFAERTITFVRVFDLDLPENRMVFRGRVSAISDIMDTSGRMVQELTCASALDFLEDTGLVNDAGRQYLRTWLGSVLTMHNTWVEPFRRVNLSFFGSGEEWVPNISSIVNNSKYNIISKILTDGTYLRRVNGSTAAYTMEFKEHYTNDTTYFDVKKEFGTDRDTAFLVGDNLTSIRVEQSTDGGVYTAVCAVSGVNSDNTRETYTAYNMEMKARYPGPYTLIVRCDEIRCTAPMYEYVQSYRQPTEACIAMRAALKAYAEQEAANLSVPPIKITLTAADLAAMGFTGYEPFELGGNHPLVFPKFGYNGQRVRITSLKRRLTDGKIEQIVIEQGKIPGKKSSNTLSALMAQLNELNDRADDNIAEQLEIMDTKLEEQTGGVKIRRLPEDAYGDVTYMDLVSDGHGRTDLYVDNYLVGGSGGYLTVGMTKAQYDALTTHSNTTIYIVDDNGTTRVYIGDQLITQQGGGGGTIETAAVLSSEQMTYWAPDHQLVPVDFRGGAHIYYSQPPAKIVIQKQHGIIGSPSAALVSANDLYEEITLEFSQTASTGKQKLKISIAKMLKKIVNNVEMYEVSTSVVCSQVSGSSELIIGTYEPNTFNVPTDTSQRNVGLLISVNSLTSSGSDPINPANCVVYAAVRTAQSLNIIGAPSISGSFFNPPFTAEFLNEAERNFALGVTGIVEPEPSNGGGGE